MRSDAKALVTQADPPKNPALHIGTWVSVAVGLYEGFNTLFPNLVPDNIQIVVLVGLAFILPVATSLLIRNKVWSPASVQQVIQEATKEAIDTYKEIQATKTVKPKNVL